MPADLHIFQRGGLNHQPVLNLYSGGSMLGIGDGMVP